MDRGSGQMPPTSAPARPPPAIAEGSGPSCRKPAFGQGPKRRKAILDRSRLVQAAQAAARLAPNLGARRPRRLFDVGGQVLAEDLQAQAFAVERQSITEMIQGDREAG